MKDRKQSWSRSNRRKKGNKTAPSKPKKCLKRYDLAPSIFAPPLVFKIKKTILELFGVRASCPKKEN